MTVDVHKVGYRRSPWSVALCLSLLMTCFSAMADWQAVPDPFGGSAWKVQNSETGQTLSKNYSNEKKAKKAAKTLNKSDKSVMPGPDGEGDFRHGGELPK